MDVLRELEKVEEDYQTLQYLRRKRGDLLRKYEETKEEIEVTKTSLEILQEIARKVQSAVHAQVAKVVSDCLSGIFENPYSFRIEIQKKRNKTEADLIFEREGLQLKADSLGGGVVDVASFGLRVVSLLLHRPPLPRLLLLDEPFRFVSQQYQENVRLLLEQIAEEFDIQIIMITHNPNLVSGKVFRI